MIDDLPSPFVVDWLPRVAAALKSGGPYKVRPTGVGTALDLAMGGGRHAHVLARAGFRTFGVDVKLAAVRAAVARARAEGLVVNGWCADLTATPLPSAFFDLLLVTRYLQRDLFASIRDAVKAGAFVMYETFTVKQRQHGFGPTASEHLLEPGELLRYFDSFDVVFYEEVDAPEAVARIVARRRRLE